MATAPRPSVHARAYSQEYLGRSLLQGDASLFVDNLPPSMNEEKFRELFTPYCKIGMVNSVKFLRHMTGHETGYGFVEFSHQEDGRLAIQTLNGKIIDNHQVRVIRAKAPKQSISETNLYVEGLPDLWKEKDLLGKFQQFGEITLTRVLVNRHTNKSRNVGFVHFAKSNAANVALNAINNAVVEEGEPVLVCKFAKVQKPKRTWGFKGSVTRRNGGAGGKNSGGTSTKSTKKSNWAASWGDSAGVAWRTPYSQIGGYGSDRGPWASWGGNAGFW